MSRDSRLTRWGLILLMSCCACPSVFAQQASKASDGSPAISACNGFRWVVNAGSLKRSQPDFPLDVQKKYFDSPCTFLVVGTNVPDEYRNWTSVRTKTITSVTELDDVVSDPSIQAVLYDPEGWQMTPRNEQQDPAGAACRAEPVVHEHNKVFIVTPATNLVRVLVPTLVPSGRRFEEFANTEIAGSIAKCADVYEIQGQGAERDTVRYREFVEAVAKQARAANPKIVVLAGISTNPMGQHVSAKDVYKAVQSVRGVVDGFWLNIPAGGKFCPSCGDPQPKVAVELLQMLEH